MSGVPAIRWTLSSLIDPTELSSVLASCVRHGGFILGAQRFDNRAFGTSPASAGAMDPQQRLLLDVGMLSLSSAGFTKPSLAGLEVGVFVGVGSPDFRDESARDQVSSLLLLSCFKAVAD